MQELSDIDLKAALRTILHEVKVNTFETNIKIEAFQRQIKMIMKNQIEMLELKQSITEINGSLYCLSNRMEGTQEKEKRLKQNLKSLRNL